MNGVIGMRNERDDAGMWSVMKKYVEKPKKIAMNEAVDGVMNSTIV